jgi:hypothetical protein
MQGEAISCGNQAELIMPAASPGALGRRGKGGSICSTHGNLRPRQSLSTDKEAVGSYF